MMHKAFAGVRARRELGKGSKLGGRTVRSVSNVETVRNEVMERTTWGEELCSKLCVQSGLWHEMQKYPFSGDSWSA